MYWGGWLAQFVGETLGALEQVRYQRADRELGLTYVVTTERSWAVNLALS